MQQKLVLADRPIRHYTAPSCLFVRHSLHPSLRLFGYLSAYVLSFWQNISLDNLQNSIQFWKCFYLRTENRLKQKKIAENVSLDEWNLSFTILSLKPITSNAQFPICPKSSHVTVRHPRELQETFRRWSNGTANARKQHQQERLRDERRLASSRLML